MEAKEIAIGLIERLRSGEEEVEEILVDIKREWYDKSKFKTDFPKDVCALANASNGSIAYIIFGLSKISPYLFTASLPLDDESKLQAKLRGRVVPNPNVRFEEFEIDGIILSAAIIQSRREDLPYVAYDSDNWLVWTRYGTRNTTASHHDLVSFFRNRYSANQYAELKVDLVSKKIRGASNWSINGMILSKPDFRQKINTGLNGRVKIVNTGNLDTAINDIYIELVVSDDEIIRSQCCFCNKEWPIPLSRRAGFVIGPIFLFENDNDYLSLQEKLIEKIRIVTIDIDGVENSSSFTDFDLLLT